MLQLREVFVECSKCQGGVSVICNVEGCPSMGHVSQELYKRWRIEKHVAIYMEKCEVM